MSDYGEDEAIRHQHDHGLEESDVSETGWQEEDPFATEPAGEETWESYGETETPGPPTE